MDGALMWLRHVTENMARKRSTGSTKDELLFANFILKKKKLKKTHNEMFTFPNMRSILQFNESIPWPPLADEISLYQDCMNFVSIVPLYIHLFIYARRSTWYVHNNNNLHLSIHFAYEFTEYVT